MCGVSKGLHRVIFQEPRRADAETSAVLPRKSKLMAFNPTMALKHYEIQFFGHFCWQSPVSRCQIKCLFRQRRNKSPNVGRSGVWVSISTSQATEGKMQ